MKQARAERKKGRNHQMARELITRGRNGRRSWWRASDRRRQCSRGARSCGARPRRRPPCLWAIHGIRRAAPGTRSASSSPPAAPPCPCWSPAMRTPCLQVRGPRAGCRTMCSAPWRGTSSPARPGRARRAASGGRLARTPGAAHWTPAARSPGRRMARAGRRIWQPDCRRGGGQSLRLAGWRPARRTWVPSESSVSRGDQARKKRSDRRSRCGAERRWDTGAASKLTNIYRIGRCSQVSSKWTKKYILFKKNLRQTKKNIETQKKKNWHVRHAWPEHRTNLKTTVLDMWISQSHLLSSLKTLPKHETSSISWLILLGLVWASSNKTLIKLIIIVSLYNWSVA